MLQLNSSFKAGIQLANKVEWDRLSLFLERIVTRLIKNENPFTLAEEQRLLQILGLSAEDLHLFAEACTFVFERAATHSDATASVSDLVKLAGLPDALLATFEDTWKMRGPALIHALKERAFGVPDNHFLADVQWQIHLQVGGGGSEKNFHPLGILQLGLLPLCQGKETEHPRFLALETPHEELVGIFEKIEHIQEQLDSMSKEEV